MKLSVPLKQPAGKAHGLVNVYPTSSSPKRASEVPQTSGHSFVWGSVDHIHSLLFPLTSRVFPIMDAFRKRGGTLLLAKTYLPSDCLGSGRGVSQEAYIHLVFIRLPGALHSVVRTFTAKVLCHSFDASERHQIVAPSCCFIYILHAYYLSHLRVSNRASSSTCHGSSTGREEALEL